MSTEKLWDHEVIRNWFFDDKELIYLSREKLAERIGKTSVRNDSSCSFTIRSLGTYPILSWIEALEIAKIPSQCYGEYARQACKEVRDKKRKQESRSDDWSGDSWEKCQELASTGWKDGLETFMEVKEGINLSASVEYGLGYKFDVAGSFPDISRCIAGDPECMVEYATSRVPKTVRIGLPIGVAWNVPQSSINLRGACAMAVIDALEAQGINSEVWAYFEAQSLNTDYSVTIPILIKSADSYMDRDSLAFWAGHPGAFRQLGFSLMEAIPSTAIRDMLEAPGGSYGYYNTYVPASEPDFYEPMGLDFAFWKMPYSEHHAREYISEAVDFLAGKAR